MSNPYNILEEIMGDVGVKPNPVIAFEVWSGKQPFFQKIPTNDEAVIKIKAGDFRRIAKAAYEAGFMRAKP